MLQRIDKIDKKLSTLILQLDKWIVSWILYPFAAFYHPRLIWISYALVYYFSNFNLRLTLVYLIGTGVCLLTTYILKRVTKRQRPLLNKNVRKSHKFRSKQKNHSFPSGDAIQSALFINFMHFIGVPWFYLIIFHVLVCLGRVYFMCHWIFDTVASTILGTVISQGIILLENNELFLMLQKFITSIDQISFYEDGLEQSYMF